MQGKPSLVASGLSVLQKILLALLSHLKFYCPIVWHSAMPLTVVSSTITALQALSLIMALIIQFSHLYYDNYY